MSLLDDADDVRSWMMRELHGIKSEHVTLE